MNFISFVSAKRFADNNMLPRDRSVSISRCKSRARFAIKEPGGKMKGLSGARNEHQPHYGRTRFPEEKKILIVLTAVAAACSAIKGSVIKGTEAVNGDEAFLRETPLLFPRERMSQCPPPSVCRPVDKCTRNLTRPA